MAQWQFYDLGGRPFKEQRKNQYDSNVFTEIYHEIAAKQCSDHVLKGAGKHRLKRRINIKQALPEVTVWI